MHNAFDCITNISCPSVMISDNLGDHVAVIFEIILLPLNTSECFVESLTIDTIVYYLTSLNSSQDCKWCTT